MADHHDIDKHIRSYMMVFGALLVLTLVTVAISYLQVSTGVAVALALLVATIKGALVAAVFMHLSSEKRLIYAVMTATIIFFLFVLLIPVITELDEITVG